MANRVGTFLNDVCLQTYVIEGIGVENASSDFSMYDPLSYVPSTTRLDSTRGTLPFMAFFQGPDYKSIRLLRKLVLFCCKKSVSNFSLIIPKSTI